MTGAGLTIEVDGLAAVRKSLGKLIAAGHDATPLMRSIGEGLLNSTRDRFATETDPDGGCEAAATGMERPSYGANRIGRRAITRTMAFRELPE